MVWKPHVTVAALATDNDGRFLLVEETIDGERVVNQPAGHLEPRESLLDAVEREALEETGWRFVPQALVGIYHWHHPEKEATFIRAAFAGRVTEQVSSQPLDDDIERAIWLSPKEIERRRDALRSPMVERCVRDYQAGCQYPLAVLNEL